MLSGRLIQLIEAHQEQITASVLHEIHSQADFVHMRKLPDAELRERVQEIVENLGQWLTAGHHSEIQHHYEELGPKAFRRIDPAA